MKTANLKRLYTIWSLTRWHSKRERTAETVETSALRRLGRGWNESERPERMTAANWADIDGAAVPSERALWMAAIGKRNWWCGVASENKRGCKSETALKEKWSTNEGAVAVMTCVQRINEGFVDGFDQIALNRHSSGWTSSVLKSFDRSL